MPVTRPSAGGTPDAMALPTHKGRATRNTMHAEVAERSARQGLAEQAKEAFFRSDRFGDAELLFEFSNVLGDFLVVR